MKKLLLSFAMLLATVGAWADISQTWTSSDNWGNDVTDAPEGVVTAAASNPIKVRTTDVSFTGGGESVTVGFTYSGGNCALCIVGVDLVNASGEVVANHYEYKHAGGDKVQEVYTLNTSSLEAGLYQLRYFVRYSSGDRLNDTNGNIAVTGALTEAVPVEITYNYKWNGVKKAEAQVQATVGLPYPAPSNLPYGVVAQVPEGLVAEDVTSVDVECTLALPFEVSTDYATAHWYALKIRDDGFTYLSYDSSKEYIPASASAYSIKNQDNYMWAFIGNPFDGFKVINKAAGDAKILSAPSAPTGNKNADQLARMVAETGATGNIVWNLKAPTHNNAVANVFYIEHPTATSYALNRQSFNSENALCYWNQRDTGSAMLVEEAYDFSQFGDLLFNDEQMQDGKIYRIQSSTRKTFTGIDGYTCNMKNQDYDTNNPGQLWKYVVDGDKAYLQNVYAGLYPQYVNGGGDKTTSIGTSKDYAFTYSINNKNVEHIWNIFFGGRQVNIEGNGNVNWWSGENAHHCIYEVEATDEELATMCMNWYNANQYVAPEATASSYQKIAIDGNATEIISPSEFAAPSDINEAIDNLAAIEGTLGMEITSAGDIHTLFGALSVYASAVSALTEYKNAVTAHGELLSIAYTPKAEWGTIILPINWAKPEGWTRYSCASTEGNVLALTEYASGASKNTPMIIQVAEDKIGTTYQMIGYSNGAGTENVTAGLLTGVLEDNTFVPEGSYVLSKYNGKIGFYPVSAGTNYEASKYKCYLTLPAASARYNALYFDETETGIIETEGENAKAEIYDMSGRRVQKVQKGLYIVNGVKVIK